MKKKIGMFFIRIICVLFILGGIANFIAACNGEKVSTLSEGRPTSESTEVEGVEAMLYSLGVSLMGGVALLMTRDSKKNGE